MSDNKEALFLFQPTEMTKPVSHRFALASVGVGCDLPAPLSCDALGAIGEKRDIDAMELSDPLFDIEFPLDAFVGAVVCANNGHYRLGLDPDSIWLRVVQAVGMYVAQNADDPDVRGRLVSHKGVIELRINADAHGASLSRFGGAGSAGNRQERAASWASAIKAMGDLIVENTTPVAGEAFFAKFTASLPLHHTAQCCSLMSVVQKYFHYTFYSRCAIPEVTLYGAPADYDLIVTKARALAALFPKFDWYFQRVLPTLERLRDSAHGTPDVAWWRGVVNVHGGSGVPHISGWITDFVAFTRSDGTGPCVPVRAGAKVPFSALQPAVLEAPFVFETVAKKTPMRLLSGFLGLTLDPERAEVRPVIGWATLYDDGPGAPPPPPRRGLSRGLLSEAQEYMLSGWRSREAPKRRAVDVDESGSGSDSDDAPPPIVAVMGKPRPRPAFLGRPDDEDRNTVVKAVPLEECRVVFAKPQPQPPSQ